MADFGNCRQQGRFRVRSDRKASRIRRLGKLVHIIRQSRLTKQAEQLREGLMILDRKLSALAGRDRFRIEKARADICAERHTGGITFEFRTFRKSEAEREWRCGPLASALVV